MGFVYFIFEEGTHHCKIGVSINPEQRLQQLQTGNSKKLVLYRTVECADPYEAEARLHEQNMICKLNGEWYLMTESQVDSIVDKLSVTDPMVNKLICDNRSLENKVLELNKDIGGLLREMREMSSAIRILQKKVCNNNISIIQLQKTPSIGGL